MFASDVLYFRVVPRLSSTPNHNSVHGLGFVSTCRIEAKPVEALGNLEQEEGECLWRLEEAVPTILS